MAEIVAATGLCLVRGPLGVGKTVLAAMAAQELRAAGRTVAWIDVVTGTRLEDLRERVATAIEAGPADLVLVLDDVDRSTDPRVIPEVLDVVARHSCLTVVATARRVTPLESRIVRARTTVTQLGPELDLMIEDIADVLGNGDTVTAERLHTVTGGHALTLGMLLVALADSNVDPGLAAAGTLDRQALRCVREILDTAVSRDVQHALGPLAIPHRLTNHIARVLGGDEAVTVLTEAAYQGLGSWTRRSTAMLLDDPGVFDLVGVFRRTLRADFRALEPQRERTLVRQVVDASLAERGYAVAGIAAMESGSPALLDRVCRAAWFGLRDVDLTLLRRAMQTVESWDVERYPTLALTLGLMLHQDLALQHRADHYFDIAARGLQVLAPRQLHERAYLGTIRSMALRFQGRTVESVGAATAALDLVRSLTAPGANGGRTAIEGHGFLLRNIATALFLAGENDRAAVLLREAHAEDEPGSDSALLSGCLLALVTAWSGDVVRAEQLLRSHPGTEHAGHVLGTYGGRALLTTRAIIAAERNDPVLLADALEQLRTVPMLVDEFAVLRTLAAAMACLVRGEPGEARDVVEASRHGASYRLTSPVWRARLDAVVMYANYALGERGSVVRHLRESPGGSDRFVQLVHAAVLLAAGNLEEARLLVGGPDDAATDTHANLMGSEVLRAVIALRDGDEIAARNRLTAALDVSVEGTQRAWLALTAPDREALMALLPAATVAPVADGIATILPPEPIRSAKLSDRELVVLRELARTSGTAAVASALQVSVNTVKSQIRSIYRKLEVGGRAEALARARENGLL
ncbi:regulatory protein, LuxR [Serinibacter arcticus]|uniref:Regulatory protein, LuxR n=1 Tax=Serinibacter arcticus TaxID=1655435 RepID=A0A4Z1E6B0_9MICO|nr:regulatory protein, LuxR [Serinibacter arcticus]